MPDLLLDLPTLEQLHWDLTMVVANFYDITPISKQLSGAVGDDGLAGKVQDFADGWDIRRTKITEAMQAIDASVKAIHDTFSQVDAELAAAVTQGA